MKNVSQKTEKLKPVIGRINAVFESVTMQQRRQTAIRRDTNEKFRVLVGLRKVPWRRRKEVILLSSTEPLPFRKTATLSCFKLLPSQSLISKKKGT